MEWPTTCALSIFSASISAMTSARAKSWPVARGVVGNVRRRIATLTVGDAPIGAGKTPYLRLPSAVIAGKFVNKDDRRPSARLFVVQVYAIAGLDFGHSGFFR